MPQPRPTSTRRGVETGKLSPGHGLLAQRTSGHLYTAGRSQSSGEKRRTIGEFLTPSSNTLESCIEDIDCGPPGFCNLQVPVKRHKSPLCGDMAYQFSPAQDSAGRCGNGFKRSGDILEKHIAGTGLSSKVMEDGAKACSLSGEPVDQVSELLNATGPKPGTASVKSPSASEDAGVSGPNTRMTPSAGRTTPGGGNVQHGFKQKSSDRRLLESGDRSDHSVDCLVKGGLESSVVSCSVRGDLNSGGRSQAGMRYEAKASTVHLGESQTKKSLESLDFDDRGKVVPAVQKIRVAKIRNSSGHRNSSGSKKKELGSPCSIKKVEDKGAEGLSLCKGLHQPFLAVKGTSGRS